MTTSRVEACIQSMMASHPGVGPAAQSRYFEAVHQELAPLARLLEKELALVSAELNQRADQERDLTRRLRSDLAASQERVKKLHQALMNCQAVAAMRGDQYLCDSIDNNGKRYQSAWLAALLEVK